MSLIYREKHILSSILKSIRLGLARKLVVLAFFIAIGLLVFGTLKLGWYYAEICGLFLGLGIVAGFCDRMTLDEFGNAFAQGMG